MRMPRKQPASHADTTSNAHRSAALFTYGFVAASFAGPILAGSLHHAESFRAGANVGAGIALGVCIFLCTAAAAFFTRTNRDAGFGEWVQLVGFAGSRELRHSFKRRPAYWETVVHILSFDVMIKYVCPPVLIGAHL